MQQWKQKLKQKNKQTIEFLGFYKILTMYGPKFIEGSLWFQYSINESHICFVWKCLNSVVFFLGFLSHTV